MSAFNRRNGSPIRISFERSHEGQSYSILIPAQKPFTHRGCFDKERWTLLEWFSKVETRAWDMANTFSGSRPPDEIFLVLEQKLTSGYSIGHCSSKSAKCDLLLSTGGPFPAAGLIKSKTITATVGTGPYRTIGSESGRDQYSVFLRVYRSPRIGNRLLRKSFQTKVGSMYR